MNNCKNNNEQLEELKKMGLDGLYKLVLDQQKQLDGQQKEINNLWNKILVLNLRIDKAIINGGTKR